MTEWANVTVRTIVDMMHYNGVFLLLSSVVKSCKYPVFWKIHPVKYPDFVWNLLAALVYCHSIYQYTIVLLVYCHVVPVCCYIQQVLCRDLLVDRHVLPIYSDVLLVYCISAGKPSCSTSLPVYHNVPVYCHHVLSVYCHVLLVYCHVLLVNCHVLLV